MIMPFGKHKGKSIHDLPHSYLYWLVSKCEFANEAIKNEAIKALNGDVRREIAAAYQRGFDDAASFYETRNGDKRDDYKEIDAEIRAMCCILHPDHGGTVESMKRLNRIRELIAKIKK